MSDRGSRESSFPTTPSKTLRRQVQLPARYRDVYDEPETSNSPKKRGRPPSPSKRLSSLPPSSPMPVIVDDPVDPTPLPPPPPPQQSIVYPSQQRARPTAIVTKKPIVPYAQPHHMQHAFRRPGAPTTPQQPPGAPGLTKRMAQNELTEPLKENLRRLKNLLKLPQARRWVYCEFFYSCVDEELLLADNEFSSMLTQAFPNLKTRKLNRAEWRTVRRLIGKPRRCSAAFLEEERKSLDSKRQRIRQVYEGTNLSNVETSLDLADLPQRLPRPLVVGMKIYARVRTTKDGVYSGVIDAVLPDSYRVVFDKEDLIPPQIIRDSEVMTEQKHELVPLSYFVEQSKVNQPTNLVKLGSSIYNPIKFAPERQTRYPDMYNQQARIQSQHMQIRKAEVAASRDEKVGNFPVRMLVILVKLAKLIDHKKTLVRQLSELNAEAEKTNLVCDTYTYAFQDKYARVVVDVEAINKQMSSYLTGIQEYYTQLLPQLTEVSVTSRPEALRKLCTTHARQIVKHCNNGLNVRNKEALNLITNLTSLLLQIRSLGQQRCTPLDMNTLSESLNEIRTKIAPQNIGVFQDCVEVHMKQIHNMMINSSSGS